MWWEIIQKCKHAKTHMVYQIIAAYHANSPALLEMVVVGEDHKMFFFEAFRVAI